MASCFWKYKHLVLRTIFPNLPMCSILSLPAHSHDYTRRIWCCIDAQFLPNGSEVHREPTKSRLSGGQIPSAR